MATNPDGRRYQAEMGVATHLTTAKLRDISGYPWIWCTPAVSVPADWLHVCAAQGWFGYTAERIWAMHRLSKSRVGRRTPNSRWVYTGVEVA
jgi:hypothetical protein